MKRALSRSAVAFSAVAVAATALSFAEPGLSPFGGPAFAQQKRSGGSGDSGGGGSSSSDSRGNRSGGDDRGGTRDAPGGTGSGDGGGGGTPSGSGGASSGGGDAPAAGGATRGSDGTSGRPATVTPQAEDGTSGPPEGKGVPPEDKQGGRKPVEGEPSLGDLFGDLYVVLRDDNGVPILTEEGWLQPLDAEGNPIPLDAEGEPLDEEALVTVDLGRLNLSRSTVAVLDSQLEEAVRVINLADDADAGESVSLDAAGRIVVTYVDEDTGELVAKTIDSPLENLAIYELLMTDGALPGLTSPLLPAELEYLADGETRDATDLAEATAYLAAATDKTGTLTVDEIAYVNNILGIDREELLLDTDGDGEGDTATGIWVSTTDYGDFTYDRETSYDVNVVALVPSGETWVDLDGDGQEDEGETFTTWEPALVNIYDTVFADESYSTGTEPTITDFTQAADDAREVIEFIHEYALPVESTTE